MPNFLNDDLDVPELVLPRSKAEVLEVASFFSNSSNLGGCVLEALKLRGKDQHPGNVYWVERVVHAYYVSDSANRGDHALNQADNGYEGFPALTVEEVKESGRVIDPDNPLKHMFHFTF